jgi:hypothetical protein
MDGIRAVDLEQNKTQTHSPTHINTLKPNLDRKDRTKSTVSRL